MDGFQTTVTSIAVIAIIILMILFVCHMIGPKATAWVCSNHEEKIGLSNSKLFHANGYLIHSGSDILLSSSGSFKRFESIDHDFKDIGQTSITSPTWNIPAPDIPPQPLRPAPAPCTKEIKKNHKQQSCEGFSTGNTVIPRPVAKRQLSSPAGILTPINLSEAARKITNSTRSSTNPFLNGSISIPEQDNRHSDKKFNKVSYNVEQETNQNPFSSLKLYTPEKEVENRNTINLNGDHSSVIENHLVESSDNERRSSTMNMKIGNLNKFLDSPIASGVETIQSTLMGSFRNRSFSETEALDTESLQIVNNSMNNTTNPFKTNLHKTVSETYLEQYSMKRNSSSQIWMNSRTLSRQNSNISLTRSIGSQSSIASDNCGDVDMKRAMSCDSVSSDSSVVLADLEQLTPAVTGLLCVGLQYDRNSHRDEGVELIVTIMEAKELIFPSNTTCLDTFIRIYLVPDETEALQTKMFKNSACPTYNETFCFWLNNKRSKRSLWFHLYHSENAHTLLGEAELKIEDVTRPITTWLSLSDSRHQNNNNLWGELMFSLSYLPTAERLTVVVVKARNLKLTKENSSNEIQNVFVKVYLLKNDKKVFKKKTCTKRADCFPIYNESMIFSVPPYMLKSIQIRLTVAHISDLCTENGCTVQPIGHVIVGSSTTGKGLRHWNQMLSSLRKPVAMWHPVRQINKNKK